MLVAGTGCASGGSAVSIIRDIDAIQVMTPEEVTALRDIIGNAVVSVTEFGYHTGARKKWGFWSTRWSDVQCAAFAKREWQFWAQQTGVESAYIYQLNDGPTNTTLDRYGIRRLDGSWKPSADAHRS